MKRMRLTAMLLAVTLASTTFSGCGARSTETGDDREWVVVGDNDTETEVEGTEAEEPTEADTEVQEKQSVFSEVANYEFWFGSGAGGWCTTLTIQPDGSFSGQYHDSDMGDTGADYPNGIQYRCDFHGKFTEPIQVNEYTYQFQIEAIQYNKNPGEEEILDGVKYIYGEAYGLDQAKKIDLYLPNAPVADLPQEYRDWVSYLDLSDEAGATLGSYGLYNVAGQEGFSSYAISDDAAAIDEELAALEEQAQEMNDQLQSGLLAQQEMNRLSGELYRLWDDELNSLWSRLKEKLDEDAMEQLTKEQREWISWKEQEVKEAGKSAEGGTLQPLLENDEAAELTRARVYELADILKGE